MLLSPRPFGFRSVVHLGVIYPERRPPLVVILSVRDTAHSFQVSGSPVSLSPLFRGLTLNNLELYASRCFSRLALEFDLPVPLRLADGFPVFPGVA